MSGEKGGKWVLSIAGGSCGVRKGEAVSPTVTIESPGEVWVKIARGEIDRPKALMEGLYRVKGDLNLLSRIPQVFGARKKN
jgi:putative sterol carrier protein